STKAQKIACENLLSVINRCNSEELPGTMFVYAVMPEFFSDFATNYPALQQRCGPNTKINLDTLAGVNEEELLQRIGEKILSIFRVAHEAVELGDMVVKKNIGLIARESLRKTMGSGTRRLFVKTWTDALQRSREDGMQALTSEDVELL